MAVAPGNGGRPPSPPDRAPKPPLIPLELFPAPEQRLTAVAVLVLLQAWKLADLLSPQPNVSTASAGLALAAIVQDDLINSKLLKWIAIDLLAVSILGTLRIPRLDLKWKGLLVLRVALCLLDYILFGQWTFSAAVFVPGFVKSLLVTYPSTAERSTRVSKVLGNDKSHLGGQYTVHILAVSTAQLNPASSCYCIPVMAKPEPVLVPLILNNTVPSEVKYSVTSLTDSTSSKTKSISASSLIRASSKAIRPDENSEDEGLPSWALVPSSANTKTPRHRVPHPSGSSHTNRDDPFDMSPSESLYYIPVTDVGYIDLVSVLDSDGIPVRIRRRRAADGSGVERTKIVHCPRAGFERRLEREVEAHRCVSGTQPESWSLELAVQGLEPLSVKWYESPDKLQGLDGIVAGSIAEVDGIIRVPMNVSLDQPRRSTFRLDSVVDGCGNTMRFAKQDTFDSPAHADNRQVVLATSGGHKHGKAGSKSNPLLPGMLESRSVVVHRPPEVAFAGICGRSESVSLLKGRKSRLDVRLSGIEHELRMPGAAWTIKIRFTPEAGGKVEETEYQSKKELLTFEATAPGAYEIVSVKSTWCSGIVLVPNTCTVVLQPEPTLLTSFEPMHDVCKSEVGLVSTLHLTGTAPYTVHYELVDLSRPHLRPRTEVRRILSSREELRLEPGPGDWEYRFVKIQDKNYDSILLPSDAQYVRRQKVQLLGDANWKNARQKKVVHACEGEKVSVELELKGTAPWEVEYSVLGQPKQTISDIKSSPHKFQIDIPSHVSQRGGQFVLSLESVKDGNGCRRPLTTATDLVVEVQRTRPSARFHGVEGARSIVIREREPAKIPLRLTGNAPWTVKYQAPPLPSRPNEPVSPQEFEAQSSNAEVVLSNPRPGVYRLISVRDKFCPGDVSETDWTISMLPRPVLQIDESAGSVARNGSIIRAPVCEDASDSIPLVFQGRAPFKATYSLQKNGHHERSTHTIASIQPRADLTLYTSAGHHVYNILGVADTLYDKPDSAGLIAPSTGKPGVLRIEQNVFPLPSAVFQNGPKHGFCVNDRFASRSSDDMVVKLEGQPPFEIELEMREEGHRTPQRFTVGEINTHEWPVSLPIIFQTPLPHTLTIRRVVDANGCSRLIDSSSVALPSISGKTSIVVPVAEIASIQPVLPSLDACVGDFLEYVVQGAPPFTVKYAFEGKEHVVPLQSSKFQRLAAEPGEFKIVSVGHGQDQCRANDVNLIKHVHPIPTASVVAGDSVVVDIREGDQTEIIFSFAGTPPFTFTYSRRRPQDRSKDKTVLETHTVTDINEYKYSIFTSVEGSWSVSYIADAWCSYPPARSVDGGALVKG